jgi:hypothetical protein
MFAYINMKRTKEQEQPEIAKKSKIDYQDDYEDKENIPKRKNNESPSPLKLSIMLPKKDNYYDDGYETEETIPEEEYVPQDHDYKSNEMSEYERYLEETDITKRNFDDGYETDDTEIMGGKKKRGTRRRKKSIKVKKTKTKRRKHKRKTQRKQRKHKKKTHRK